MYAKTAKTQQEISESHTSHSFRTAEKRVGKTREIGGTLFSKKINVKNQKILMS